MKLNSKNRNQIYKKIVFTNLMNECFYCETHNRLIIHHKDINFNNNFFTNLLLICSKCHGEHHHIEHELHFGLNQEWSKNYLLSCLRKLKDFITNEQYKEYLISINQKRRKQKEK